MQGLEIVQVGPGNPCPTVLNTFSLQTLDVLKFSNVFHKVRIPNRSSIFKVRAHEYSVQTVQTLLVNVAIKPPIE